MARALRIVCLAAVAFSGLACEDDARLGKREPSLRLDPEFVDFGLVDLTQQASEPLELANVEIVDADVVEVVIEDDCDGCFRVADPPRSLRAKEERTLWVRYRASQLGTSTATLSVTVEETGQRLEAHLIGRATDARKPDVALSPTALDFGLVPAGGKAVGRFTVRSVGQLDLLVDRMRIEPEDAPFRITTSTPTPDNPGRLAPGASATFGIVAELPAFDTGSRQARLLVETNVLEEKNVAGEPGVIALPLSALGNLPPVAVLEERLVVEPYSQVPLDGSASYDQDDPPDLPLSYRWSLLEAPGGSRAELVGTSTSRPVFRPDIAGSYAIELVVTDALGLESDPARIGLEAFPDEAIRIELLWDHPDSDLDLHLIREGGAFCDCASSVHYRDCARNPNWFPEAPGANPSLDIDDRSGFGPENINLRGEGPTKFVPPGAYTIAVHYFSNASQVSSWPTTTSNATVRIYIYGLLAAETTRAMENERDLWEVGVLRWPAQSFELSGQVMPGAACGAL